MPFALARRTDTEVTNFSTSPVDADDSRLRVNPFVGTGFVIGEPIEKFYRDIQDIRKRDAKARVELESKPAGHVGQKLCLANKRQAKTPLRLTEDETTTCTRLFKFD